ncbi:MAG: hypothetical protein ACM3S0_12225 [Acidobacteriota bacterium]
MTLADVGDGGEVAGGKSVSTFEITGASRVKLILPISMRTILDWWSISPAANDP